jgi:hypothetical protein
MCRAEASSFWAPVDFAVAMAYFTVATIASSRSVDHSFKLLFWKRYLFN